MTVKIIRVLAVLSGVVCACSPALAKDALMPTVVTETVRNDSDDPAICIDTIDASKSLIIGTDKGDTTGGLYVYDLLGHIDTARTRVPMKRTNNVDIVSGVMLGGYLWQYQLTDAGNIARRESGRVRRVQWQERNRIHRRRPTVGIRVLLRRNRWHSEVLGGPRSRRCRRELALFATTGFVQDHEGLAIYSTNDSTGYLLASDQQGRRLQVFRREGSTGAPHTHPIIATIPVSAQETDGLDVTAHALGPKFPEGVRQYGIAKISSSNS